MSLTLQLDITANALRHPETPPRTPSRTSIGSDATDEEYANLSIGRQGQTLPSDPRAIAHLRVKLAGELATSHVSDEEGGGTISEDDEGVEPLFTPSKASAAVRRLYSRARDEGEEEGRSTSDGSTTLVLGDFGEVWGIEGLSW
jgi:hypothetical protein